MSRTVERRRATAARAAGDVRITAGFRLVTPEPLAGGPIELEFFVESVGPSALQLAVGGDRARQRPGQVSFEAELGGSSLGDPLADVPDVGGPLGVVQVTAESPFSQRLVLNEFVRLEDTIALMAPGGSARMRVHCHRPIVLAAASNAALALRDASNVEVTLAFMLRRDDAELAALADELKDAVLHGPAAERERPFGLLLSMRTPARAQIETLTRQTDQAVADRARRALARIDEAGPPS